MKEKKTTQGRVFLTRFAYGKDLLKSLQAFVEVNNIKAGFFFLIGAVTHAKVGYYNKEKNVYKTIEINAQQMEITNSSGNISLKDGKPFVHAHITLGDSEGKAFGGHLQEGTIVFAAEAYIQELVGREFERVFDPQTKLNLWEA